MWWATSGMLVISFRKGGELESLSTFRDATAHECTVRRVLAWRSLRLGCEDRWLEMVQHVVRSSKWSWLLCNVHGDFDVGESRSLLVQTRIAESKIARLG